MSTSRTGNTRRGIAAGVSFTVFVTLFLAQIPAQAVHDDGLFQLDYVTSPTPRGEANVSSTNIKPPTNTGDDWDKVYAGTDSALASSFITDGVGSDEKSFYTGGGSKDTNDIPQWLYDTVNDVVPDKSDIEHAFAAAYERPGDGHTIVYFGADRFDAGDGSAELGFWFFRGDVTLDPLEPLETTGTFSGQHEIGDLLVLVEFVRGGGVGEVNVYEWDGAGGDNLNLLLTQNAADCATTGGTHKFCAVINNLAGETPPWPYTDKDHTGNTPYQQFALFEGGIDFTALLGADIGCFSSFLAETRSSGSSVQAQLKDFALGAFPLCDIKVTKTGDTLSKIGDPVDYTIKIENTGQATLYKRNITDTLLGAIATNGGNVNPNGYVLSNTCGASLAADDGAAGGPDECTITLRRTVQAGDPDPLPNTVNILYTEEADFTGLEFERSDDHSVNLFQPAVQIDKTGNGLSKVGDDVTYTFTITNMSSQDSPNLTLAAIIDNVIGDLLSNATTAGCDVLTYEEVCTFQVTREVLQGDLDPTVNTVDVLYHPDGFPNDITASDGHSVNLFQPSVSIEKTGDALSKIGDDVTYHFKITNTSSADSPNLVLDSISDDVLGNLASYAGGCASLAPAATCEFDVPWTVAAVDLNPVDGIADDPVINTVTVHFHPDGFPNDIAATASHELNLFQPSIGFSKTADTQLSKATDVVNYTITLNNTSSPDTPDLVCTITDAMLEVNKQVTLASGAGDVTNVAYTVQAGDADPLDNTASVSCSPTGFPNVLSASSDWRVNLFQPSVTVEKGGPGLSKIGDGVIYHFKITNTSSDDSPNLVLDSINDDVLGSLGAFAPGTCDNMAPGAMCEFDVPWIVAANATDPTVNTVTVLYHPVEFPNRITDTDSHELNLFQPSITFSKTADTELSKATDVVNYTLTLNNTSSPDSPDLECTITDVLLGVDKDVTLASGASDVTEVPYTVKATDPDPLPNTANVVCSPRGFPNRLEASDSWEVNLFQPSITFDKSATPTLTKVGHEVTYTLTLNNTSSADSPDLECTITDALLGVDRDVTLASGDSDVYSDTRAVQAGDPDPLINTASVQCSPVGFPNVLRASASAAVNLFQPNVSIEKTGPALSKVGDEVTYHFKITNTGSEDSPALVLVSITDDVLGDLAGDWVTAGCGDLAPGASCEFDKTWTVEDGYGDPVINTVTVHFNPFGFDNDITATASHELNLFQPSIELSKTGDDLSKIGDEVDYQITLANTSSWDTPAMSCTVSDPTIGVNETFTTNPGDAPYVINKKFTIPGNASDPFVNTASVECVFAPDTFPNVLTDTARWSTNLFQPSVDVTKTGPAYSKAGDTATYNVTIENKSSADSPDLVLDSFTDSLVAGVTPPAACGTLAPGASCSFSYDYVVQSGDPDPLENTATAHYKPEGFPNDITDSSTWSTDLVHPSFTVSKVCKTEPISRSGNAVYTITFNNTGDADMHVVPSEGPAFDVAAGQSYSYEYTKNGPFTGPDSGFTVDNTVTGTVTLAAKYGLSNSYEFSASDWCDVKGLVKVVKTVDGAPPAVGQTFTFELRENASVTSTGSVLETKVANNANGGSISFDTELIPGQTYQLCEWVMPGWNTSLGTYGPLFVPNSMTTPTLPNPTVNNMVVCVDFTVVSGETKTFNVDNSPPPGGRALTIGFWRNWASCASSAGKGQKPILDQTLALAMVIGDTTDSHSTLPGIVVSATSGTFQKFGDTYYLVIHGSTTTPNAAPDCLKAVRLLSKQKIDGTGKQQSSDPAFNLAAQLMAAELNQVAGAYTNGTVISAINNSVLLLGKYKFNGITHDKISSADAAKMNCYAGQLDDYNNNRPIRTC